MGTVARRIRLVALGVAGAVACLLLLLWLRELSPYTKKGGQQPAEPFRIAGNFYYVGANDVSAFLLTSPEGHVLLDAGYPTTVPLIAASIKKLGFDIRDVKVLINSEPHADHGGGLAVVQQQAPGARLWASPASADALAAGGEDPDIAWPIRTLIRIGLMRYPPARVDHRLRDGETVRLGTIALTAHLTPGHTRGCTSWSFPVREGNRVLTVVSACSTGILSESGYPEQAADRARSLRTLRSLPADIWVTNHARAWGRYRKFAASRTAKDPVEPFVDPAGYRAFLDGEEKELREGRVH